MLNAQTAGALRREKIVGLLNDAEAPMTGADLAQECGVSRQVIVQDMALIKAEGVKVVSTRHGYRLVVPSQRPRRLFKLLHGEGQVSDELNLIVDLGGCVEDTLVNHRTYGKLSAPLGVASRRDVTRFLEELADSKSSLLSRVTSGYHFHHVSAPSEEALDEIEQALGARGYLVERMPWEGDDL